MKDDASLPPRPGPRRLWRACCLIAIWLCAAAVFFRVHLASGFDAIAGGAVDAMFDVAVRENVHLLLRGAADFASLPMFFPIRDTLGYSDAYLLDAIIYVPLRVIGVDPFESFELLCVALSLIGFIAFYVLLRRYGRVSFLVAAICASLFSFSNALYISIGHPQLLEVCWIPVVVILLLESGRGRRLGVRTGVSALSGGILLGLLFATGFYVAWFFSALLALTLFAALAIGGGPGVRGRVAAARGYSGPALLFFAGLALGLLPFLRIYLPALAQHPGRDFHEYLSFAPGLPDLVNVGRRNLMWGWLLAGVMAPNRLLDGELTLATTPLVAAAYLGCMLAIWRGRLLSAPGDRALRAAALASFLAVLVMWLSVVRIGPYSPFWLLWHVVPGASAIRAGGRVMVVLNTVVVAVVAVALSRLWQAPASSARRIGIALLLVVFVAEQFNTVRNHEISRAEAMSFLAAVPSRPPSCRSFFIVGDPSRDELAQQVDAVLIAQHAGLATLNGYSGWSPMGWTLGHTHQPSYGPKVWDWASRHGIAEGLCAYSPTSRAWIAVSADSPVVMEKRAPDDRAPRPGLKGGTALDFRAGGDAVAYQFGSWSDPEAPGTWTDGTWAGLAASIPGWRGDMMVELTARPFVVAGRHPALAVEVLANGMPITTWRYDVDHDNRPVTRTARIPAAVLGGSSDLRIELRIDRPASPFETGESGDGRKLGLFVSRVDFRER